jgi:hypothetical protein
MRTGSVLVLAVMLVLGLRAHSHHSFAATYDEDKTITVEGRITQFQYRNPHSFLSVEAPDDTGMMYLWGAEWGGAGQLGNQGVTRYTIQTGDVVTISGNPGRNAADHRVRILTLLRKADGFSWGRRSGERVD